MDLLRDTLGLGPAGALNFYKYSQQLECFVGFDQAYARSDLTEAEFFNLLKKAAATGSYALSDKFIGYFLQFKVVKAKYTIRRDTPPQIRNRPHYRSSLDTKKNLTTGVSQHELLYKLSKNPGAFVYYACPMVFDRAKLYEVNIDLEDLRLADLTSCPSPYDDNDNHFLYFDDPHADPVWCSEPHVGKALSPRLFAEVLRLRISQLDPAQAARDLLESISTINDPSSEKETSSLDLYSLRRRLSLVENSLTIIQIKNKNSKY
jgi:hypothetical protein